MVRGMTVLTPGQRLRMLRKKLGLRQGDLAGEKISKNYISMFENGKRRINMFNATYLSSKINNIAESRGMDLKITASYFVKSERDIAKDKCINWLNSVSKYNNKYASKTYLKLYKVISLSRIYNLEDLLAEAYHLKGLQLYKNKLYNCAIAHYIQSLNEYIKLNNEEKISKIYLCIAKTYYMKKDYSLALIYFNYAGLIKENDEIFYYKAFSYYKMGKYKIAKSISDRILFKNNRYLDLETEINKVIESIKGKQE